MNRRNFLRSAIAAAVGAAVLPRIPLVAPGATPTLPGPRWIGSSAAPGGGKITYEMLNRSYMELSKPQIQQQFIITDKSLFRALQANGMVGFDGGDGIREPFYYLKDRE